MDYYAIRTLNLAERLKSNYSQAKYNLITANNILEKTPEAENLLLQFSTMLKDDGLLLLNTLIDESLTTTFTLNTLNPHAQKKIFDSFENLQKFGRDFPEIVGKYKLRSSSSNSNAVSKKIKLFYGLKDSLDQIIVTPKKFDPSILNFQAVSFNSFKEDRKSYRNKEFSKLLIYHLFRLALWPFSFSKKFDLTEEFESSFLYFNYSSFLSIIILQIGCFLAFSFFQFFPLAVLITAPIGVLLMVYSGAIPLYNIAFGTFNRTTRILAYLFIHIWFVIGCLSVVLWMAIGKWIFQTLVLDYLV